MQINTGPATAGFEELNTFFYDIVKKQVELNNATNGEEWIFTNVCKKTNKPINWNRASWLEMAEFVESFDWKHWKKGIVDLENAKVELVDIIHFMVSQLLVDGYSILPEDQKAINNDSIELLSKTIAQKLASIFYDISQTNINEDILELADIFTKQAAGCHFVLEENISVIAKMCAILEMDAADIYKRYMIKNILNQFRQDHGYSTGEYVKKWMHLGEEKEDNIVALFLANEIVHAEGTLSISLYESIGKFYATMA